MSVGSLLIQLIQVEEYFSLSLSLRVSLSLSLVMKLVFRLEGRKGVKHPVQDEAFFVDVESFWSRF